MSISLSTKCTTCGQGVTQASVVYRRLSLRDDDHDDRGNRRVFSSEKTQDRDMTAESEISRSRSVFLDSLVL